MKFKKCTYGGVNYSHGARISSNGKEQLCRDGEWIDAGAICEQEQFIAYSRANGLTEDEHSELVCSLGGASSKCLFLSEVGDGVSVPTLNLGNKCRGVPLQVTIGFSGHKYIEKTYRLDSHRPYIRQIRWYNHPHGYSVKDIKDSWDYRIGDDVTNSTYITETDYGDGVVGYFLQTTISGDRFICFKVNCYIDGVYDGYAYGCRKGRVGPIESRSPERNVTVRLASAFLDPE